MARERTRQPAKRDASQGTPLQRALFTLGIALFASACAAALVVSLVRERRMPGIGQEYGTFVRQLLAERRFDLAAREMQTALKLDHTLSKAEARLVLAQALARSGQMDVAIGHYREAIAADPQNAVARAELGGVLAARGDFEAAAGEMRRALEIDPSLPNMNVRLAWAEGSALRGRGQYDKALERFRAALEMQPDLADVRYDLAITLAAAGQLEGAVRELQELVRLRPDPRGFNALGLALVQCGRRDEAVEAFRRGLALAPEDAELRRNLMQSAAP